MLYLVCKRAKPVRQPSLIVVYIEFFFYRRGGFRATGNPPGYAPAQMDHAAISDFCRAQYTAACAMRFRQICMHMQYAWSYLIFKLTLCILHKTRPILRKECTQNDNIVHYCISKKVSKPIRKLITTYPITNYTVVTTLASTCPAWQCNNHHSSYRA